MTKDRQRTPNFRTQNGSEYSLVFNGVYKECRIDINTEPILIDWDSNGTGLSLQC